VATRSEGLGAGGVGVAGGALGVGVGVAVGVVEAVTTGVEAWCSSGGVPQPARASRATSTAGENRRCGAGWGGLGDNCPILGIDVRRYG
jgi:hypothetical protein